MRIFIVTLFVVCFSFAAFAQEADSSGSTRIEVDQDSHVIRIIIEGNEVAQFTSSGLLVPGDINYGGTIRDGGAAVLDRMIAGGAPVEAQDVSP